MIDPEVLMKREQQKILDKFHKFKAKKQIEDWNNHPNHKSLGYKIVKVSQYRFLKLFFITTLFLLLCVGIFLIKNESVIAFYEGIFNITK